MNATKWKTGWKGPKKEKWAERAPYFLVEVRASLREQVRQLEEKEKRKGKEIKWQ